MNYISLEELSNLGVIVLLIAVEVIGIMSWIKNFVNESGSHRARNALLAFLVLIPCAFMQTALIPKAYSILFNIIFLALAVEQLAYEAVVKGVPSIVDGLFSKASSFTVAKESAKQVTSNPVSNINQSPIEVYPTPESGKPPLQ